MPSAATIAGGLIANALLSSVEPAGAVYAPHRLFLVSILRPFKCSARYSLTYLFVDTLLAVLALLSVLDDRVCGKQRVQMGERVQGHANHDEGDDLVDE